MTMPGLSKAPAYMKTLIVPKSVPLNNEGKYEFNQLWQRKFNTQNTCLYFDKLTKIYISEDDFKHNLHQLINRKFKLVR